MNNILSYIIIDILLLALSILLFLKYNNGKGGPLGSLKKRYLQPIVTQYLVCNKSEIWP